MANQNILLPELGEGVTEGELIKWLVSEGASVQVDQPVAEVMTDKAAMEVPSPVNGVVQSLCVKEGDTIQVGEQLLTLKNEKGASEKSAVSKKPETSEHTPVSKPAETSKNTASKKTTLQEEEDSILSEEDASVLATPFTRRLARELGVSLSDIQGSGLSGRVTKEDVLKKADHTSMVTPPSRDSSGFSGFSVPKAEGQERVALRGVRKKIAEKMQASKSIIPHFTLLESADVEQLDQVRKSVKQMLQDTGDIKVTYLSFVMKVLLHTIKEFPILNASIDDVSKEIVTKNYYHFGFAADTPSGLLVPVIKDVDKKSISEISQEIQSLAQKAREGKLSPDEMQGGTFTITNIGSLGGEYATPIINAPEVAILGMYRMYVKPCWDGKAFQPKKTMNFSLTCDHRLIDGAVSARALQSFVKKIESPLSVFI